MRRFQATTLLLGTLVFLTGCSRNPMSPDATGSLQPGAENTGVIQVEDTPADVSGGARNVVRADVPQGKDTQLRVGRFTLDLHKNSLKMAATITLRVSSEDATEVEVEVTPAAANDFQVAPKLIADMSDLPNTNYATVWVWNEANGAWEAADNVAANSTKQSVTAHMKKLARHKVADPEEGSAAVSEDTIVKK